MSLAPIIQIPGMGPGFGPPSDAELGVTGEEMPACICGCLLVEHAEAPDMPCVACLCDEYREDYF